MTLAIVVLVLGFATLGALVGFIAGVAAGQAEAFEAGANYGRATAPPPGDASCCGLASGAHRASCARAARRLFPPN